MQDIDDLLDEVESKYVKKKAQIPDNGKNDPKTACKQPQRSTATVSKKKNDSSAMDSVIDDILDLDLDGASQRHVLPSQSPVKTASIKNCSKAEQTRRCLPVFLGGSNDSLGLGSTVNQRACDQLRCTSCDFRVCNFDNMAWKKDTDYLFLRNNVPDFEKLRPKLIKKKGWRAYCCQCSWRNILELLELSDPELKWVCGKHVL